MTASISHSGPVDYARVDLTEANEFDYWIAHFACTPLQLIDALQSAGVSAAAVARHFASTRCGMSSGASS